MTSLLERFATTLRNGHPQAVLRLQGIENVPAAAMLTAVERVRAAVALLGIEDLTIEVVREDAEGAAFAP
ncbi:MAG: hypothetical protein ACT4PY_07580 [Armatimonadota bacterium]